MSAERTHVYILAQEIDGKPYFKFGITNNIEKRIAQLQTGSPHEIELAFAISCPCKKTARLVEQECHRYLSRFRLRGEWFRCEYRDAVLAIPAAFYVNKDATRWADFNQVLRLCGLSELPPEMLPQLLGCNANKNAGVGG